MRNETEIGIDQNYDKKFIYVTKFRILHSASESAPVHSAEDYICQIQPAFVKMRLKSHSEKMVVTVGVGRLHRFFAAPWARPCNQKPEINKISK
jgi:hypothetical protein